MNKHALAIIGCVVYSLFFSLAFADEGKHSLRITTQVSKDKVSNHEMLDILVTFRNNGIKSVSIARPMSWDVNVQAMRVGEEVPTDHRDGRGKQASDTMIMFATIEAGSEKTFTVSLDRLMADKSAGEFKIVGSISIPEFPFPSGKRGLLHILINRDIEVHELSEEDVLADIKAFASELEDEELRPTAIRKLLATGRPEALAVLAALDFKSLTPKEFNTIVKSFAASEEDELYDLLLSYYPHADDETKKLIILYNLPAYDDNPGMRAKAEDVCVIAKESGHRDLRPVAERWLERNSAAKKDVGTDPERE